MHDSTDLLAGCDTAMSYGAQVQGALIWPCCSHMDHDRLVGPERVKEDLSLQSAHRFAFERDANDR